MSGLHEAFDEIVARVPVYGDLDGAIEQAEQERRRRFSVVASLSAAAAVLLVVAGVLVIARDDDGAPQPIGPPSTQTPSPTESTATTAEWSGPIRSGTWPVLSPKQAKGWADPRDTAVPGIDIRKVTSDWTNAGWWGYALAARPPRIQSLDPAQRIFEYGVVIDADGDQDADCQVGLNNNAAQHGEYGVYRVWVTNLRTNVTDERVGPPYGFPIEFQTANEYSGPPHGPPHGLFTFLRQPRAPCDRFGTSATFYLWASHTKAGEVTAWDYAPDEAWLPMPCGGRCRKLERQGS